MSFDIKPGRGSERVKAWVYTILNPVIDSLRRETELLKSGNLSWRVHSRRCEYIRPIAELIDSNQQPNLEDFLAENATFRMRFDEHDSALVEVEQSATLFVQYLLSTAHFRQRVEQCLEEYQSRLRLSKPSYPDLSEILGRLPEYVAEFIVNRTVALPMHYTLHQFWVAYADQFRKFFDDFEQGSAMKAASKLLGISEQMTVDLETLRLTLCREYDIPAAPIEVPHGPYQENALRRFI